MKFLKFRTRSAATASTVATAATSTNTVPVPEPNVGTKDKWTNLSASVATGNVSPEKQSGFAFVDNSRGSSAAVSELARSLDLSLMGLDESGT